MSVKSIRDAIDPSVISAARAHPYWPS